MSISGARPQIPRAQRFVLRAAKALTSPLDPSDYLELINPLWSTRELKGRIERVRRETPDAATIVIKPGYAWPGHEAGQYLRIGVEIDGVRHWRAYSISSDPARSDRCISVTVKHVEEGQVSPYLVRRASPGTIVFLGGVEGTFLMPEPIPRKLLLLTAGSGITPVMAMLRALAHEGTLPDIVHIHSAPTPTEVIFGPELRALHAAHPSYTFHERHTRTDGRFAPADLDTAVPDWRERETLLCGPPGMLEAVTAYFEAEGLEAQLHQESFQPVIGGGEARGEGGTVTLLRSGVETECDGATPILVAGEQAGVEMPFGCRMGICHTCVGRLQSGAVRDLRTGEVQELEGQLVRTCIHAPEGPVALDL